jgi:aminopeptidase N
LYIDYVSKPNDLKAQGSAAITDAKGLYFINPTGEEKDKPTQIWTQGETEASSVWFVTIDKPNQKTTQEIYMTVPDKYVSLSNGILKSQKKNTDGTRTDYWKMDDPHAPYLFFMGVGDFSIIKDVPYKGKEVSYYVEKEYAPYAKGIFGNTPEMMKFFSEKLGVDFPWSKYSQIVGRDYVSGAMENTTATLHQESAYQNSRQLLDGNGWEETIAHELFHQWFGDLVTAESWSHLTVNESFANYSEYLWDEYKFGKDFADAHNYDDMLGYVMSGSEAKNLVRHQYKDKEDMFDAVSYNKGGRILHMLRNYVGDDAFFKSLNLYLTQNKFKTGEAAQLRLAVEEVTGKDMNWFWNQWYYGSGHPKLKINYNYDIPGIPNTAEVIIEQTQKTGKVFMLPIAVDVYINGKAERYNVWTKTAKDTFYFKAPSKPELINVDADKILLAEKTDNKSEDNFIAQFKYAKNYLDRREAIDFFAKKTMTDVSKGLTDKFAGIRLFTIQRIAATPFKSDKAVLSTIEDIAKMDKDKKTRAAAIAFLVKNGDAKYLPIYQTAVNDSSYTVAGAALKGLIALDGDNAYNTAKKYSSDAKGALGSAITEVMIAKGTEIDFEFIANAYKNAPPNQDKVTQSGQFAAYLAKLNDVVNIKKGVDYMMEFRNLIPKEYWSFIDPTFQAAFDKIIKAKGGEVETYIKSVFK